MKLDIGIDGIVGLLLFLVILEPRFTITRLGSVGPAVELHLQQPQIDAELELLHAVVALDDTHPDFVGFVGPSLQNL